MKFERTGLSHRSELTVFPLSILISLPFAFSIIAVARWAPDHLLDWAHCPLREATSIPCPTCGSTLAMTRLAGGNWLEAIVANPLLALLVVGYVAVAMGTIVMIIKTRWYGRFTMSAGEKKAAKWLAAILVLANWVWIFVRSTSVN